MKSTFTLFCIIFLLVSIKAFAAKAVTKIDFLKLTNFYCLNSEYDSALKIISQAHIYYSSKNDYYNDAIFLIKFGEIQNIKGNYKIALESIEKAKSMVFAHLSSEKELIAKCLDLTGDSYKNLGDVEIAYTFYKDALKLRQSLYGENDSRTAHSFCNIASYFSFKIKKDSAYFYSKRAFDVCKKYPVHNNDIELYSIYSEYAYDFKIYRRDLTNDWNTVYDSVRIILFQALTIIKEKYSYPSNAEASILHSLGNTYTDIILKNLGNKRVVQENFIYAKSYYESDLKILKLLFGEFHPSISSTYYTLGLLHSYSIGPDFNNITCEYIQKAINALLPLSVNEDVLIIPSIDSCLNYFDLSVLIANKVVPLESIYRETKDIRYLLSLHEHNKLRIKLWDKIMLSFQSNEVSQLIHLWNNLPFEEATKTAYELYKLTNDSNYLKEIFIFSEKAKNTELSKAMLLTLNSKLDSGFVNLEQINKISETTISIAQIQKSILDNSTALIEYFTMPKVLGGPGYIFIIEKTKFRVELIQDLPSIDSLLKEMKTRMNCNSVQLFKDASHKLYSKILEPAINGMGKSITNLLIVPHGITSSIPFDALVVNKDNNGENDFRNLLYLMKQYNVSYALSATVLDFQKRKNYTSRKVVTGFTPKFSNQSSLPFSTDLINSVSNEALGDYYIGENATATNFIGHTENSSILFLATHADVDKEHPKNSKLYFTDNFLTLDKIYSMHYTSNLVVLSGCETSIGQDMYSEGMKSFARAFTYAGCKSTISTLWKVDDKATSSVLGSFFEYLFKNNSKNEALHNAKLNYLNHCKSSDEANPFYWSGIVLTGDGNCVQIDSKHSYSKFVAIILILGLAFFSLNFFYTKFRK